MPKYSGVEVLTEIGRDEDLRQISVVVLTGTLDEGSVLESYGVSPSRFMRKPIDVARFDATVTTARANSQGQSLRAPETWVKASPVAEAPAPSSRRWWWPFG